MSTGRTDTFASVLQEAVDAAPDAATTAERAVEADTEAPAEPAPVEDQAAEDQPEPREDAHDEAFQPGCEAMGHEPGAARAEVTQTIRRGEPERQAIAGNGTDSPHPSSHAPGLLAAVVVRGALPAANGPVVAGAGPAVQAVGAAKAGQAQTRGIDGEWQRANSPLRTPATVAGYRTSATASAQLLEQARDSVFKQILVKLNPEGGEMSLRLQPPELGELDLHMVVEGGNRLSLSIGAERADLAHLIQRHLDELKQTLERSGLEVTDAQVHTRGDGSRGDREQAERHNGAHRGEAPPRQPDIRSRSGGYVTAEGLDFWV
jgi:hypothetical protein